MAKNYINYGKINNKIYLLGFGCIGKAILPLLFRHLELKPEQLIIITDKNDGIIIAEKYNVQIIIATISKTNYQTIIGDILNSGDFILNLSVNISSLDLIKLCQQKNALYLDTCTEPWEGGYTDSSLSPDKRSNYVLREALLDLKKNSTTTAVVTHGANPGLISHFVKQALWNMAKDCEFQGSQPNTSEAWAKLASVLGIKAIHIAECDTQIANSNKMPGEFINTWSVDGFISEGLQPAELGWGTHERHWPDDAEQHDFGPKSSIYLKRPGAATKVRTWTPLSGPYHGYLITHAESISISNYLTLKDNSKLIYRPTVHYAYIPCPDAILSLHEFASKEWQPQEKRRLLQNEIIGGIDALGVLLMGNPKGAYWFGSQLSIQQARELAPYNNATSLQVAAGILGGMIWALQNPNCGIVEAEEMDYQKVLEIANPYLGIVAGYYTDWTPLKNRESLFAEQLDYEDPWQFLNIRVV